MNFDILEIGVGNYDIASTHSRGPCLLCEPNPEHAQFLRSLNNPLWTVEESFISSTDGSTPFFYIPSAAIAPADKWVNGIGATIPNANASVKYKDAFVNITVPTLSVASLLAKYSVTWVNFVKIDAEGHDHIIIASLAHAISSGLLPHPNRIQFESNTLSSQADTLVARERLSSLSYKISTNRENTLAYR